MVEAVHDAVIARWLSMQPDLPDVVRPNGDPRPDDATMLGWRIKAGR